MDDAEKLHQVHLVTKPMAKEILSSLANRYRIGLVTDTETSDEISVRSALRKLHLDTFFSAVVTSTDIGITKPNSKMFIEALKRLAVTPEESLMVGNDPVRDIDGASQLGITTVLFRPSKYFDANAANRADYVIDSLDELPALINDRFEQGP